MSQARSLVGDLASLGTYLASQHYQFTTVSPATHARMLQRNGTRIGISLRDIFGWNLPFSVGTLPHAALELMRLGGLVTERDGLLRSAVRFATLGDRLYAHDAFPTTAPDSVFFGPDTYRFVAAMRRHLLPCDLLVDLCCGSGAGGLEASLDRAERVVLADINPKALAFAAANRLLARDRTTLLQQGDLLEGIDERPDAIIANPPYFADPLERVFRDGGGDLGTGLSLRIVREALAHLAPGGQLLLYTGTPVIGGVDLFAAAALPLAYAARANVIYEEIDPDIFGDELENPAYRAVERIAAVVLSLTMP
jgi:SAM-dependent methyltransferase